MNVDRPMLGIALMLGFCVTAPLGDSTAKLLGQPEFAQPVFQVLLLRFVMQGLFLVPLAWATGRAMRMPPKVAGFVFLRTVLHILGVGLMFTSLQFMPLADAIAIAFVMPFILLLMGWALMGEQVGWRRLAACAVGFVGTLFVVQPSFATVGWPALLPIGVAFAFAFFMLVTRRIAKETDPIGMQGVSGLMATALLVPIALAGAGFEIMPLEMVSIPTEAIKFYIMLGVLGSFGHLLMTWSLRFAPSATLAPMQYLEIPIATIIGWAVFGDLPNGLAAIGIGITVAAGLYIILRERAIARQTVTELQAEGGGPGAAV